MLTKWESVAPGNGAGDYRRERRVFNAALRELGERAKKSALIWMLRNQLGISHGAAKCLLSAQKALAGKSGAANLSARVPAREWYMMYDLIRAGYSETSWGVLSRALAQEHLRVTGGGNHDTEG